MPNPMHRSKRPQPTDRPHLTDRNETSEQRLDRNWNELLQEMRVLQTGTQLIAGFLLTLPFQQAFEGLDDFQRRLYLTLVLLAGLTTALMLAPIAVHRRLFGEHVKQWLVATGHQMVIVVLGAVGLLVAGIVMLIFDVVVGRGAGWLTGGLALALVVGLLVVLPLVIERLSRR
jgi:hypothetical protein